MSPRRAIASLLALSLAAILPGCGSDPAKTAAVNYNLGTLEEVGDLYRSVAGGGKAAPKSIKDLARNKDLFLSGYNAVDKGEIVVNWGVTPVPGETATDEILAYKSDVPTAGGPVLLKNGTIKTITAAEFKK